MRLKAGPGFLAVPHVFLGFLGRHGSILARVGLYQRGHRWNNLLRVVLFLEALAEFSQLFRVGKVALGIVLSARALHHAFVEPGCVWAWIQRGHLPCGASSLWSAFAIASGACFEAA